MGHIFFSTLGAELGFRRERCAALGTLVLGLRRLGLSFKSKEKIIQSHERNIYDAELKTIVRIIVCAAQSIEHNECNGSSAKEGEINKECLLVIMNRIALADRKTIHENGDSKKKHSQAKQQVKK